MADLFQNNSDGHDIKHKIRVFENAMWQIIPVIETDSPPAELGRSEDARGDKRSTIKIPPLTIHVDLVALL